MAAALAEVLYDVSRYFVRAILLAILGDVHGALHFHGFRILNAWTLLIFQTRRQDKSASVLAADDCRGHRSCMNSTSTLHVCQHHSDLLFETCSTVYWWPQAQHVFDAFNTSEQLLTAMYQEYNT